MPEPSDRIRALLAAALALPAAERGPYLECECAGDVALRQRLATMLGAHARAEQLPDGPADADPDLTRRYVPAMVVGMVVAGRYKLLEQIGEGGMGTVWVAEQTAPVKRKVAVKLIKIGMDSRAVLARFEAERQALAMMDHPNIAKVLDGGIATDDAGGAAAGASAG